MIVLKESLARSQVGIVGYMVVKQIKHTWLLDSSNFGFRIEWERSFQFYCSNALHSFQSLTIQVIIWFLTWDSLSKIFCFINNRLRITLRLNESAGRHKLTMGIFSKKDSKNSQMQLETRIARIYPVNIVCNTVCEILIVELS